MKFYRKPSLSMIAQSDYHNTTEWENSIIGRLNAESKGSVYIREVPYYNRGSDYSWKIVDAYYSDEDSTMTYFRAYDENGNKVDASFGVSWDGCPHRLKAFRAKYQPEFGNHYLHVIEDKFHTPNTGGYYVQVLDEDNPSEALAFGLNKAGNQHKCLIISFMLFKNPS